jgi:uncharacterized membrane protein
MSAEAPTEQGTDLSIGPVQMLVLGFDHPKFTGQILPELQRLKELDVVRLLDLMVVQKKEDGELDIYQQSDLEQDEAIKFGALVGALIGIGTGDEETAEYAAVAGAVDAADGHVIDQDDVWYIADTIPAGSAAAIALIEHRWAIPLRDKIIEAGGFALADEWIHPADLVAVGMAASKQISG